MLIRLVTGGGKAFSSPDVCDRNSQGSDDLGGNQLFKAAMKSEWEKTFPSYVIETFYLYFPAHIFSFEWEEPDIRTRVPYIRLRRNIP